MEQYEISSRHYFQEIQKVLKHFQPERIFVRFVGSASGKTVLCENLKRKKLVIVQEKGGIRIRIDGKDRFYYETTKTKKNIISGKRWGLHYERIDKNGRMHFAHMGYPNPHAPYTGPDDPALPPISKTFLRAVNGKYYIEIVFSGKIPIKKLGQIPGYTSWDYYYEVAL